MTASALSMAASVFFLKKYYFATLSWRTNIFFFSTHCLMYKKSNSFVYKFAVNCQVSKELRQGLPYKAEYLHVWLQEQYFLKHHFLYICRCAFKCYFMNGGLDFFKPYDFLKVCNENFQIHLCKLLSQTQVSCWVQQ